MTFFHKFVFPVLYILAIFNFLRLLLFDDKFPKDAFILVIFPVVMLMALAVLAWLFFRANKVEMDDEYFYVSNYRKEISIPRADLYEATEMRWSQPYWITLHLRRPSEFGERIVFVPPWRFGAFWTRNPLVDDLNASRTPAAYRSGI